MPHGLKILLMDDCKAARLRLAELLEPFGKCSQAGDGYEGYSAFLDHTREGEPFDVVFSDVMMPKLDGPGAIKLIREAEQDLEMEPTPVVVLSSMRDTKVVEAVQYEAGADGYLSKPVSSAQIGEVLFQLGLLEQKP